MTLTFDLTIKKLNHFQPLSYWSNAAKTTAAGKTDRIAKVRFPGLHTYCGRDLIRSGIGLCRVRLGVCITEAIVQTDQFSLIDKLHGMVQVLILLVLPHIVTTFSLSSMQLFQCQYVYSGYRISQLLCLVLITW